MLDCKSPTRALVCSLSLDLSMWIQLWELNFRSKQRGNLDHIALFPCSIWIFLVYFEWKSVDFIHLDAHIHVLSKRGIRDEMYQFSMLSTPFSFSTEAIDSNSVPARGQKAPVFSFLTGKEEVIIGYNTQIQCVSSLGDASVTSSPLTPSPSPKALLGERGEKRG